MCQSRVVCTRGLREARAVIWRDAGSDDSTSASIDGGPLRCCRGAAGDVEGLDADFKMRGTG